MSKPSNQRVAYHHLTDREEMEKTAAREKSDLKKAIDLAKEGKWPDAMKIVASVGKTYSKDRDFTATVADFTRLAKEHMKDSAGSNDFIAYHSKARKGAIKSMEKMLAAFRAGYPNPKGVKVLQSKTAGGSPFGPGNKVKVEWDFGDTDLEDLPYKEALRKSRLPEKVKLPKWLVEQYFEDAPYNEELIGDWLSDEYGFTHHGWSKRGSKTASDEPTSVETVGALHFIKQIQRVAERTAGYKGREKMEIVTDLDMKVISGDWDEDVSGPSQPLYSGTVKYKAKVYAVSTGLLGNPTLWEDSGTGKIFSDPGGGFYFKPQGRGVNTGNKGLDQIVRNSLDEAVYHNSGQITRAGSLHLARWKAADEPDHRGMTEKLKAKLPNVNGLWSEVWLNYHQSGVMEIMLHTKKRIDFGFSTYVNRRWGGYRVGDFEKILKELKRGKMPRDFFLTEGAKFDHVPTKNAAKKRKALYVGVMLSPGDKKTLEAWWKKETGSDLLRKSYMHHMTIKFKPSPEDIAALSIGDPVPLKVVGWAADGQAQAVLVQPSGVRSSNSHPHVTVATDGTSPAYSNDLIKSGPVTKASGPTLKGRVGIFTGKDVQYDLTDTIYEEE